MASTPVSLGKAAREEGMDAETIESALVNLADLEEVAGIESWIEQNLS